jgi:hypothetical protein
MTDWTPEVREVPVELIENPHATYPKPLTRFATVLDQIAKADMVTLKLYASGIGEPVSREAGQRSVENAVDRQRTRWRVALDLMGEGN